MYSVRQARRTLIDSAALLICDRHLKALLAASQFRLEALHTVPLFALKNPAVSLGFSATPVGVGK
jgi:hypothetical protein